MIFVVISAKPQIEKLRKGVDILVATPGRLKDLESQKEINLKSLDIFVLDEADRMLDMGFIHDVKKIISMIPEKKADNVFQQLCHRRYRILFQRYSKIQ